MTKESLSLIPNDYKDKDPRTLLYHFPSMHKVKLVKMLNKYYFYRALESAEQIANKNGFILLPFSCMHWQRKRDFAEDRKVHVLGKSFFMMKITELTKSEKEKLVNYIDEKVINHVA